MMMLVWKKVAPVNVTALMAISLLVSLSNLSFLGLPQGCHHPLVGVPIQLDYGVSRTALRSGILS